MTAFNLLHNIRHTPLDSTSQLAPRGACEQHGAGEQRPQLRTLSRTHELLWGLGRDTTEEVIVKLEINWNSERKYNWT